MRRAGFMRAPFHIRDHYYVHNKAIMYVVNQTQKKDSYFKHSPKQKKGEIWDSEV